MENRTASLGTETTIQEHDFRTQLLPIYLGLIPIGIVAWIYFALYHVENWEVSFRPLLVCILLSIACWNLRIKHYRLACWTLILGLVYILDLAVGLDLSPLMPAYGILVIAIASSLLSPIQSLLAGLICLASLVVASATDTPPAASVLPLGSTVTLYGLTWCVLAFASHPVHQILASTLEGWTEARSALLELRERRSELYRVVRALEEAMARIERVNNQLVVAQNEAEQARALKSRLTATVSHELRGPLNLILGFSEVMALSPESYPEALPAAFRADVMTVHRNCKHLVSLVDDVLDLSKIEAHKLPLVKETIDINQDVVAKVVETVGPLAERRGLYLNQDLAEGLPLLFADGVRLRQALLNLLTNALRFTKQGGITIRTAEVDGRLLVRVEDTGPGIASGDMPNLFREFSQLQQQGATDGTGLGLSISKHLVELHGGQIWAESDHRSGTAFSFALPTDAEKTQVPATRTDSSPGVHAPATCLVLHEDPRVARLLSRYIEGYNILGLRHDANLPEMVERLRPRAIISEQEHVPQIMQMLASVHCDVPTIGCRMPHLGRSEIYRGTYRYLVKPVVPEFLVDAVTQISHQQSTSTILLVDDDPDTVRLMERILMALPRPYRILKAYDGVQALELMSNTIPDIIVIDLMMPRMGGEETIARMRQDQRLRNVPVVVVSAHDWLEDQPFWESPISLQMQGPMSIAVGTQCIRGIIENASPCYDRVSPRQP